jgi:hypothetical protein
MISAQNSLYSSLMAVLFSYLQIINIKEVSKYD